MKKGTIIAILGIIAFISAFIAFDYSVKHEKGGILISILGLVLIVAGIGGVIYGNELRHQEDLIK